MKNLKLIYCCIILLCFTNSLFAKNATVIFVRGNAHLLKGETKARLTKGSPVQEFSSIQTASASVVKVRLPDNSVVTVGPKSEVKIEAFRNGKDPSIINVASGMMRSMVPKESNEDVKMVVRTRSAVMGVRGTEFQTIYNPKNNVSSTITFSGNVAMTKSPVSVNSASMLQALNSKSVSIGKGQVSVTNFKQGNQVTVPTKLSPTQFNSLKRNNEYKARETQVAQKGKKVIPAGLSTKKVAPKVESLSKSLDIKAAPTAADVGSATISPTSSGSSGPIAGGYVDLKTGLYIPPPEGSTFDPNAGVYVPNEDIGKVDSNTGEFIPDEKVTLTDQGEWVDSATGEVSETLAAVDISTAGEAGLEMAPSVAAVESEAGFVLPVENPFDEPGLVLVGPDTVEETSGNSLSDTTLSNNALKTHTNLSIKLEVK